MSFTLDISRFVAKANMRSDAVVRRIAYDVFSRVIMRTPVDTGRARANWLTGVGAMPVSTTDATDKGSVRSDGNGSSTAKEAMAATLKGFVPGTSVFLANNLPYIGVLEYGGYPNPAVSGTKTSGGFSIQAPAGMVGVTMAEVERIYTEATESVKRRGA